MTDVNTMLEQYEMTLQLQTWLKQRHKHGTQNTVCFEPRFGWHPLTVLSSCYLDVLVGLPLPMSMGEAQEMAQTDRRFMKVPGRGTDPGVKKEREGE